ncbi:hypothetical protein MUK42_34466 [Musa troglodytarum]|uniref:Secreted protein n=1 Tax=Musa troglodytarum TaxID=320322 RepID=A0A9E7EAU8_9LILI|nr:hypothetical protein MUK42_34466 [Musa troglodytarum]
MLNFVASIVAHRWVLIFVRAENVTWFHGFGAVHQEHKVALFRPNDRDVVLCYLPKLTGSSIGLILRKIHVRVGLAKRAEAATRKRLHRKSFSETRQLGLVP